MNKNTQTAEEILREEIKNSVAQKHCGLSWAKADKHDVISEEMINEAMQLYRQQGEKHSAESEANEMLKNPLSFDQAKEQVRRLNERTLDQPWPFVDVLKKLIEATEILLHQKDYDGHSHEEILICLNRGKEIIETLSQPKQGEGEAVKVRTFTENEIAQLQNEVYKITGKGEVMMLFNKLLGVNAG